MNEMDKIQIDKLEEYVKDYLLYIDTCSLMFDAGIGLFWGHILPLLKKYNKKIYMPKKCWLELKKHSEGVDPHAAHSAREAMQAVREYQKQGYISVKESDWEAPGTFADNVFLTVFNMYRTRNNLLLITQDVDLSKDILNLNDQNAVNGKRCLAKRINKYGFLNHYDWEEEVKKDGHPTLPQKQAGAPSMSSVPSKEKFRICTTLSTIPADPIHLSRVPVAGDTVYDQNGNAVRLGDEIGSGGEGAVYKTDTPYVAKIYRDEKLTQRKYEKLKLLLEKQLKCEGICFPASGVYNKNKEFVGFLMPMAKGKELQKSIFLKPKFLELFPDWKKKDLVELCITILKKMQYLHDRNIIMGDINAGNILVVSPTEVYFVDTDSYQIDDLPCPVGVTQFTPPELQGKPYNSFLRTMGNENFAVATLMFMLMLSGKSPYAQLGGEDVVTNIKNMEFPYPCGERSNKKTPEGLWGYIWSHLSFDLKEAFYETFQKGGKYSTEETRLSVSDWITLFKQYYYELTDPQGHMLKNDAMSGELFPTRFKKNPNATYISCRLCKQEVDEASSKNGICKNCLRLPAGKCKRCGKDLDFTNFDRYVKNKNVPELCNSCMEANYSTCGRCGKKFLKTELQNGLCAACTTYKTLTCSACGKMFAITYGEKESYERMGFELPKRCETCRKNGVTAQSKQASRSSNAAPAPQTPAPKPQKVTSLVSRSSTSRPAPAPKPQKATSPASRTGTFRPAPAPKPQKATLPASRTGTSRPAPAPKPQKATPPASRTGTSRPASHQPSPSKPRETREEKLAKKKKWASAKVQRLCEDAVRSIEGFHPLLKAKVKRSFQSLLRSIELCTDFDDINGYVDGAEEIAKEIDFDDFD